MRNKYTLKAIATLLVLICSTANAQFSATTVKKIITSDDGYPLISYRLKMVPDMYKGKPSKALIIYIHGSTCESVLSKMDFLAGPLLFGASVVVLERRGIDENRKADEATCNEFSGKETRVEDHLRIIREYSAKLPKETPVILIGGSEGADVAATVAAREPRVTELVLIGGGGAWTQAEEFQHFLTAKGSLLGLSKKEELDKIFDDIKANPDSLKMWAGHSYRRWSSYLWDRPSDYLVKLDIPIFVAQGDKDDSVPVGSARALSKLFSDLGKTNLTYKEYKNANHSFINVTNGVRMTPLMETDILQWLRDLHILSDTETETFIQRVKKAHPECFAQ